VVSGTRKQITHCGIYSVKAQTMAVFWVGPRWAFPISLAVDKPERIRVRRPIVRNRDCPSQFACVVSRRITDILLMFLPPTPYQSIFSRVGVGFGFRRNVVAPISYHNLWQRQMIFPSFPIAKLRYPPALLLRALPPKPLLVVVACLSDLPVGLRGRVSTSRTPGSRSHHVVALLSIPMCPAKASLPR
jgi:hypothetical protein